MVPRDPQVIALAENIPSQRKNKIVPAPHRLTARDSTGGGVHYTFATAKEWNDRMIAPYRDLANLRKQAQPKQGCLISVIGAIVTLAGAVACVMCLR